MNDLVMLTGAGGGGGGGLNFSDNEVPSGAINGSNLTFTLAHTPNPAASLSLYRNGLLQIAGGTNYTLATATITFAGGVSNTPKTGDTLIASYRY